MRKLLLISLLFILSICSVNTVAGQGRGEEYDIKAYFLYNFTKYIYWPALHDESEFRIGVLGKSKILPPLERISEEKEVDGKPIRLLTFETVEEVEYCHILFLADDRKLDLENALDSINTEQMLTVGESFGYATRGVVINFFMEEKRVRFEMNRSSLLDAGLSASSQLMKLAVLVEEN